MSINIIVEDGTDVANANSYETLANARLYALNRGVVLSSDDDILASQMINAFDWLEAKGCKYQGIPTNYNQSSQWPRTGVFLNGYEIADDVIPKQLKSAQIQLTMALSSGVEISPIVEAGEYVVEEKVGPLTTKYADPTKIGLGDLSPQMTAVEGLLAPLFGTCGQSFPRLRGLRA